MSIVPHRSAYDGPRDFRAALRAGRWDNAGLRRREHMARCASVLRGIGHSRACVAQAQRSFASNISGEEASPAA
jgi:hypothetical protein